MILVHRRRYNVCGRVTRGLVLCAFGIGAATSTAQSRSSSPTVVSASVPFYPRTLQVAHIEGTIPLRVATHGRRVSSIEIESGQPMLAQAAKENVETWQFEEHSPTSFELTFRYKLLPAKCDPKCNCDDSDKSTVLLQLPDEVEVSATEVPICSRAAEDKH
jgi:hypothetical protein